MVMFALLVVLYVIAANGFIVPTGCFVAAWVLAIIQCLAAFVKSFSDGYKQHKDKN